MKELPEYNLVKFSDDYNNILRSKRQKNGKYNISHPFDRYVEVIIYVRNKRKYFKQTLSTGEVFELTAHNDGKSSTIKNFNSGGKLVYEHSKDKDGLSHGYYLSSYSDGEKKEEGFYSHGKKVGTWTKYITDKKIWSKEEH